MSRRQLGSLSPFRLSVAVCLALAGCSGPIGSDKESSEATTDTGHSASVETGPPDSRFDDSHETDETAEPDTHDTGSEPLGVAAAKLIGESSHDFAGGGVAKAGDVDGDGLDDLLVGAYGNDVGGSAYLVTGPVSGRQSLSLANAKIVGTEEYGYTGATLAGAGDADGDGYADILIGGVVDGASAVSIAGRLFYGPVSGMISLDLVDVRFTDSAYPVGGGYDVTVLGDLNSDGWDDLLIGSPGGRGSGVESDLGHCSDDDVEEYGSERGESAGRVYVALGPYASEEALSTADGGLIGEDGGDAAGMLADHVGDLDGDGEADIFVGAPGNCEAGLNAGAAYVVAGSVIGEQSLGDADAKLMPQEDANGYQLSIAGGGDSNGDGYGDLAVAWTWGGDEVTGIVYLVLGPALGPVTMDEADASLLGEDSGDSAGSSVSWIGDTNLDGFDDLAIGAAKVDVPSTESGAAYIAVGPFSGAGDLSDAEVKLQTGVLGDGLGYTLTGVGDTNGDGLPDLLVGAPGDDEGADLAGAAWLLLGGAGLVSGTL